MPLYLQGDHEEADTLIAFHVKNVTGNVIVRASYVSVQVTLIAAFGNLCPEERCTAVSIMDCGTGNNKGS